MRPSRPVCVFIRGSTIYEMLAGDLGREGAESVPISRSVRERFVELARAPEGKVELDEGALLIAAEAYPDLDVDYYLRMLDRLADSLRPELAGAGSGRERIECLRDFLFERCCFAGNQSDYKDPRNSFLNDVLERRTGLPIALSIVYIEVARRVGLPVRGVNFPAHFMAKYVGEEELLIDPFFGRIVSKSECLDRLRRALGRGAKLDRDPLECAHNREVLVRMLTNLKNAYIQARDFARALGACDRILLLGPDAPLEIRDRGLVYQQLECYGSSRADLERFLELAPDHETCDRVHDVLASVRRHADRIC